MAWVSAQDDKFWPCAWEFFTEWQPLTNPPTQPNPPTLASPPSTFLKSQMEEQGQSNQARPAKSVSVKTSVF